MSQPSIKIESVFGQSRITVSDGTAVVSLWITRRGISDLIGELETVLDMADDDETPPSPAGDGDGE